MLAGTLAAASLHVSGSTSLAQLAGAWTSVCGATWAATLLRRDASLTPSGAAPLTLVFGGLLLGGRFASELSGVAALLLGAAPLAPWIAELPFARRRSPRMRAALAWLAVAVTGGAALVLEWTLRPEDPYAAYR